MYFFFLSVRTSRSMWVEDVTTPESFTWNILFMIQIETIERLVVALSKKIGGFSIYLGVMMLLNLLLFLKGRKHAMNKDKKVENENVDL